MLFYAEGFFNYAYYLVIHYDVFSYSLLKWVANFFHYRHTHLYSISFSGESHWNEQSLLSTWIVACLSVPMRIQYFGSEKCRVCPQRAGLRCRWAVVWNRRRTWWPHTPNSVVTHTHTLSLGVARRRCALHGHPTRHPTFVLCVDLLNISFLFNELVNKRRIDVILWANIFF